MAGGTAAAASVVSNEGSTLSPQLEQLLQSGTVPGTAEAAEALSVAVTGAGSLQTDAQSRLSVTVTFAATPTEESLDRLRALGAEIVAVSPFLPKATVFVPTASLTAVSELDDVVNVANDLAASVGKASAALPRTFAPAPIAAAADGCRAVPVSVDGPIASAEARARFGVDGTGVTVGIISDSFDAAPAPVSTAENDVLLGVLPGAGNPCGYTQPVEFKGVRPATGTDEGRAMAQLVHGVAPGARLIFAAGAQSPTTFSAAVTALADAGADVIVDDVLFGGSEPMYQQGEIAAAVDAATARGILMVSAAQNHNQVAEAGDAGAGSAIGAFTSSVYTPMACPSWVSDEYAPVPVDCHNFGTEAAPDASNAVDAENNALGQFTLILNWAEPVNGVTGAFSPAIFTHVPDVGGVPQPGVVEGIGGPSDRTLPIAGFVTSLPSSGTYDIYVVRARGTVGADVRPGFRFAFLQDEADTVRRLEHHRNTDTVTVGPNIFGHTTFPGVLSVGAAPWTNPTENERFSSVGPSTYLFGPVKADNSPSDTLLAPDVRSKPDLTSLDGGRTSFFEPTGTTGVYEFFGTSSASPVAAGVAALAMQYSPQSSAQDVRAAMVGTTSPMTGGYLNLSPRDVHGTGLLNATATLAALPAAVIPDEPVAGEPARVLAASGSSPVGSAGILAAIMTVVGAALVLVRRRTAGRSAR